MKASAAGAGLAAGAGAFSGFPTVWAQNIKDITLAHVGGSYSAIKEIGEQATKDLGFKVEMQAVDPATQARTASLLAPVAGARAIIAGDTDTAVRVTEAYLMQAGTRTASELRRRLDSPDP